MDECGQLAPSRNSRKRYLAYAVLLTTLSVSLACGGGTGKPPVIQGTVAATSNPLVASFTVSSNCAGTASVEFGPDTSYGRMTSSVALPKTPQSTAILVAGMRAETAYHMRPVVECRGNSYNGDDTTFTTGALPSVAFPALQVSRPDPPAATPESSGIELIDLIGSPGIHAMQALFTDRDANPIWFYDVGEGAYPFTFKLLANGNFAFSIVNTATPGSFLREVDLAGNTVRELSITQLQQAVAAAGFDFVPASFHHDILPLDNGHLIVLVYANKNYTDLAGYSGTILVQGDQLIDLDENWNPVWAWNSFDHLDVNRHLSGLPDWTHSNAIVYTTDGNLLLSMRHQSWVLKIDYQNGKGTGDVLWRLGYQGDFSLSQGDDPSLWFSFQHFPSLISQSGSQMTLAIWDNGDSRPLDTSGTTCTIGAANCYSRATVFQLDENAKTASLLWNDLPGLYSIWGGSINQLANGNVEFDVNSPSVPPSANVASEVQEVTQTATPELVWKMDIPVPFYAYRAYRVPSLYPGVTWQY